MTSKQRASGEPRHARRYFCQRFAYDLLSFAAAAHARQLLGQGDPGIRRLRGQGNRVTKCRFRLLPLCRAMIDPAKPKGIAKVASAGRNRLRGQALRFPHILIRQRKFGFKTPQLGRSGGVFFQFIQNFFGI